MEWLNYLGELVLSGLPAGIAFSAGVFFGALAFFLIEPSRRSIANTLGAVSGLVGGVVAVWWFLQGLIPVGFFALGWCVGLALMFSQMRRPARATAGPDWLGDGPTERRPREPRGNFELRGTNIDKATIERLDEFLRPSTPDRDAPSPQSAGPSDSAPPDDGIIEEAAPKITRNVADSRLSVPFKVDAPREPRKLNANFFQEATDNPVQPHETLRPGALCDLQVDIGPEWKDRPSIVTGLAHFPEQALPPSDDGHEIQIVFVSDDFLSAGSEGGSASSREKGLHAATATAWVWLPRGTGRSHPIIDGKRQHDSGPAVLRFRAPMTAPAVPTVARGRLLIYFENNLLQSAAVRATVGPPETAVTEPNDINVDFVLTERFQDVGRLAMRDLVPALLSERSRGVGVGLHLTLNEDGGGTHRIIVPSLGAPAYIHYDPVGMKNLLEDAREAIGNCFWQRDDKYRVIGKGETRALAIDKADNGRSLTDFEGDLLELALFGQRLYEAIFAGVDSGEETSLLWRDRLKHATAVCTTIQIARTGGPANFVFPWGLIYDYPLVNRDKLNFCRVLDEWSTAGRRTKTNIEAGCPHRHEAWHQKDTLCPYGFWGMRHRIEQPPNLRGKIQVDGQSAEPERVISVHGDLVLNAAFTTDSTLDKRKLEAHAVNLGKINRVRFAPPPATDWDGVLALMKEPQLVYFLCHGEFDASAGEPYLGVGLRDAQNKHRVYPNRLGAHFRSGVDPATWARNTPLIVINGCHTADLIPGRLLNFISTFTSAGASGLIGTEVSIILPVAAEVGEMLFTSLAKGETVADAIRSMRWALANRGNLLGLAYTPYCFADLKVRFDV